MFDLGWASRGIEVIITSSADRTATVWDARTHMPLFDIKEPPGSLSGMAFSPDGTRIATSGYENLAKIWDARIGMLLFEMKGHTGRVEHVAPVLSDLLSPA